MRQQNDWYTGIDHYNNSLEKEIQVEIKQINTATKICYHGQVEMLFVLDGKGIMVVNGCDYPMERGSLFCLYSHHFHFVKDVAVPLEVVTVRFYIGLFMYMSWEKHPRNANAKLMYDTIPVVRLSGKEEKKVRELVFELVEEEKGERFQRLNMMGYKTLELHSYYCRYAYEEIGIQDKKRDNIWEIILKLALGTGKDMTLQEAAQECGLTQQKLNQKIKEVSGYTFHQIKQYSKVGNACALLHFPELSMEYISELLNYSSIATFYRTFGHFLHMTPREYQEYCIHGSTEGGTQNMVLQFYQYMLLHSYEDLTLSQLCQKFVLKEYTVKRLLQEGMGQSFEELLSDIRVKNACALLTATDKSVLEIATACGFESLATFERHFKRCVFQTPIQYRNSLSHDVKNDNKT